MSETDSINVFYGRDAKRDACQVVVKQYSGDAINELLREIKVHSELKSKTLTQMKKLENFVPKPGLPQLIDYKIRECQGEIIITNEGLDLDKWGERIAGRSERRKFVYCMLPPVIMSLKAIHDLGYCHGDLKPENICARQTKEGRFSFTLTGLGNCAKLAKLGDSSDDRVHRGNLIFSSLPYLV